MLKKILLSVLAFVNLVSSVPSFRPIQEQVFDQSKFEGKWLQVSSNYYIQSIEEVDWKCVTTEVYKVKPYVIKIAKTPIIHNTYRAVNQSVIQYGIHNNLLMSGENHLLVKGIGPIVNGKYDYVILTKNDNITQYVWARDYYRYLDYKDDITDKLTKWDYASQYKKPLSSYEVSCLTHPN